MKRILASMAVLGLMASPALAASATTTTKPAAAQTKHKTGKKLAANNIKTSTKTAPKKSN
jgi:hypothetical protein